MPTIADKLKEKWRQNKDNFLCAKEGDLGEVSVDVILLKRNCSSTDPREYTTEEIFKLLTPWVPLVGLTIHTYRMRLPVRIMVVSSTTKTILNEVYREKGVLLADNARLYLPDTNGLEGSLTVWWLHS